MEELCAEKNVVIFGVPGAFTTTVAAAQPTCRVFFKFMAGKRSSSSGCQEPLPLAAVQYNPHTRYFFKFMAEKRPSFLGVGSLYPYSSCSTVQPTCQVFFQIYGGKKVVIFGCREPLPLASAQPTSQEFFGVPWPGVFSLEVNIF